jgi:hypothetical protein
MSIAEAYDAPAGRQPLVPPSPPRAPDGMTAFGRMLAMRVSPIGTWGRRAYEEDIIRGRFAGAAPSSSTRRMRSGMCWSTITRIIRARRPAFACCARCSAKAF